jgi:hypothetical protein
MFGGVSHTWRGTGFLLVLVLVLVLVRGGCIRRLSLSKSRSKSLRRAATPRSTARLLPEVDHLPTGKYNVRCAGRGTLILPH